MMQVVEYLTCAHCSRRVEVTRAWQVYCSRQCQDTAKKRRRRSGGIQSENASSSPTHRRGRAASAKCATESR